MMGASSFSLLELIIIYLFISRKIPDTYHILFLQGGGIGHSAASAMNMIGQKPGHMADYFVTGTWSAKAAKEASKYGKINYVLPEMESYTSMCFPFFCFFKKIIVKKQSYFSWFLHFKVELWNLNALWMGKYLVELPLTKDQY